MNQPTDRCLIWPKYPAKVNWVPMAADERKHESRIDSPRAGGEYDIAGVDEWLLRHLDERHRARLTTRLIDRQRKKGQPLLIREKHIKEACSASDLQPLVRARRLLELLDLWSTPIGKELILFCASPNNPGGPPQMEELGMRALAWSESTTERDLRFLCQDLTNKGWIGLTKPSTDPCFGVAVTVMGHAAVNVPRNSGAAAPPRIHPPA